ncbi:MAG: glutamate--cysteine ligase [Burkholderiales bacterium]|nr:glutamate--cysteine ligase [Burkholderiales bacterium]
MSPAPETTSVASLGALPAFRGYGIELEYMIVGVDDLSVRPIADQLFLQAAGYQTNEVERGMLGWSNELALHVFEVKNLRPTLMLQALPNAMQTEIRQANRILAGLGARLMPTAMHPWMNPATEGCLWPHDHADLYAAYGRIFDVKTHGWFNLQSMHINLPFADDAQFARLHAATRLVLPILPAVAASSPIADGKNTSYLDYRMQAYRRHTEQIPSLAGAIIPENASNKTEYQTRILDPMLRDIAPHDPKRLLAYEWLNSRGAIARFDRNAIEIRVIDTQEHPQADLAIAAATISVIKSLYDYDAASLTDQQAMTTDELAHILWNCVRDGEQAVIDNAAYLRIMGITEERCTAKELWQYLIAERISGPSTWSKVLNTILREGPLARRILRATGNDYSVPRLREVYRTLCDCLQEGRLFLP